MTVVLQICVTCRGNPPSRDRMPAGGGPFRRLPVARRGLGAWGTARMRTTAATRAAWTNDALPGRCIAEIPPCNPKDTA